jgi:dTDP-4-amino-4,6-dideoxygalactose transaminase
VAYPANHTWQLFVIRLDLQALTVSRNEFVQALAEEKIGIGLHFLAVHLQSFYRKKYGYKEGDLPHTEKAAESIMSLPLYPRLTEQDQDRVVEALRKLVKKYRR